MRTCYKNYLINILCGFEQCRNVYGNYKTIKSYGADMKQSSYNISPWGHWSLMIYHWLITNVKFIKTMKTNQGSMKHFQVPQGLRKPLRGDFVIKKSLRNIYAFIYINLNCYGIVWIFSVFFILCVFIWGIIATNYFCFD